MRKSRALVAGFLFATACQSAPPLAPPAAPTQSPPPVVYPNDDATRIGVVHVAGAQVLDGENQPLLLRGIAFGNQVWQNVADPRKHYTEADYARVAAMHTNAVRFYLNAVSFEDPSSPGQFKPAGWAWMDDNVAWAKKHGIYLILNMHSPPGGYQSLGEGKGLWESAGAQKRLLFSDASAALGKPALVCAKNSGKVWFDDVAIEQLDKNAKVTKKILKSI